MAQKTTKIPRLPLTDDYIFKRVFAFEGFNVFGGICVLFTPYTKASVCMDATQIPSNLSSK